MQQSLHDESYSPTADTVKRVIAGETILVPVRNNIGDLSSIFVLNEIGTLIWSMIEKQSTLQMMIESIMDEYEVDQDQAHKDVTQFVEELQGARLIYACSK